MYPRGSNWLSGIIAMLNLAMIPCFFAFLSYVIFGTSVIGAILGGLGGGCALYRYVHVFDRSDK